MKRQAAAGEDGRGRGLPRSPAAGTAVERPVAERATREKENRESGAAVADFVLISGLLTFLVLGILQFTLILHVRNTLIDAASSGARYGALADRTTSDAKDRAKELISGAVGEGFTQDVEAAEEREGRVRMVTVTVRAPLPVIGLLGPGRTLEVRGHAARGE